MRKLRPKPRELASEERESKEKGMIWEGEQLCRPDMLGYVSGQHIVRCLLHQDRYLIFTGGGGGEDLSNPYLQGHSQNPQFMTFYPRYFHLIHPTWGEAGWECGVCKPKPCY